MEHQRFRETFGCVDNLKPNPITHAIARPPCHSFFLSLIHASHPPTLPPSHSPFPKHTPRHCPELTASVPVAAAADGPLPDSIDLPTEADRAAKI